MAQLDTNAHRLLGLFELMRESRPSPAIARMHALSVSFAHVRAMHVLAPDRTLAMKDLAEQLQLTPPSVTALTRRLVQTGLVRREPHPEDSRVSLLSLTAEGQALLQEWYQSHLERMRRLLQGLTVEDQQLFLNLLERAVYALQSDEQG
ncbi:MAG: MarR family transcriptional regulator [Chloroflexota bacterium]|nr:MarR family transcriptional regulator [Chloroflexota bacterium]